MTRTPRAAAGSASADRSSGSAVQTPCPEDAGQRRQRIEPHLTVLSDGRYVRFRIRRQKRRAEERHQRRIGVEAGKVLVVVEQKRRAEVAVPGRLEEPQHARDGRRTVAGHAFPAERVGRVVGFAPVEQHRHAPRCWRRRDLPAEPFERVPLGSGRADLGRVPGLHGHVGEVEGNGQGGPARIGSSESRPRRRCREQDRGPARVGAQRLVEVALGQGGADGDAGAQRQERRARATAKLRLVAQAAERLRGEHRGAEHGQHERARRVAEAAVPRQEAEEPVVEIEPAVVPKRQPDRQREDRREEPQPAAAQGRKRQ